jgi:hypothetical protein
MVGGTPVHSGGRLQVAQLHGRRLQRLLLRGEHLHQPRGSAGRLRQRLQPRVGLFNPRLSHRGRLHLDAQSLKAAYFHMQLIV